MRLPTPLVLLLSLTPSVLAASAQEVDFSDDVRPILSRACFACHGPDEEAREARLRLDVRENALGEDGSFAAIVPGDAEASELVFRIHDDQEPMPPRDSGYELTPAEIEVLERWIEQGAPYEQHWAFVTPAESPIPEVARMDWPRNELDSFVLAVLEERGLAPSPEADRRTLLRRVTLDLTGLPPTPRELSEFLADEEPGAYERAVDRLLASPHYGEHMARFWLDAARYGDTHGLHLDNYREMWPYRDRVVESFNENQPYDAFVVEQLAGDLLPEATLEQQIGSGFNRCNVTTNEGGSIVEEVYVRNVVDRVSTTGTVFLGLTVGCASCHDHKFDPITKKEFYSLFAFFNNIDGGPMDGNVKDHAPVVKVPSAEQQARRTELEAERDAADTRVLAAVDAFEYSEPVTAVEERLPQREVVWVDDELPGGAQAEGSEFEWVDGSPELVHSGERSMRRTSEGLQQHYFRDADRRLRVGADDVLFAWVRLDPESPPREIMLQFNDDGDAGWDHRAFWGEDLVGFGQTGTPSRWHMGDLPEAGVWTRLEVPAATVGLVEGDVVHGVAVTQYDGTAWWDRLGILSSTPQEPEDHVWVEDELPEGANPQGDGKTWNWVEAPDHPVHGGRRSLRRSMGDRLNQDFFTGASALPLRKGDVLFAHVWLDPEDPPSGIQLQFNDGNWEHRVRWGGPVHGAGREGGADFVASAEVPEPGRWHRLEVDVADVDLGAGSLLNGWAFSQVGGTVYWDTAGVRSWGRHDDRHLWSQLAWEGRAPGVSGVPKEVLEVVALAPEQRSEEQVQTLRTYYLRNVWAGGREVLEPLEAEAEAAMEALAHLEREVPTTLVMKERMEPRPAYELDRGAYDARGEEVGRLTPAALPPMAEGLPRDRLGLARWLVDPEHPLTARVTVNRFWQQLFGTGIVRTSEDFGNQGEPPSHPELLDWLARRFIDEGWDVKATLRRIVLSATYRQSSASSPEAHALDPGNRWLARGPRFRLDAEAIRDQALAVSGLLVRDLGGPSVKPPQPDGLWKVVGYSRSNTVQFKADAGPEKVHRRSLYTFLKRTAPAPQLSTFDAPNRESCSVRRERTNTPLQALLLMNDPQFLEAARHLAWRAMSEGGATPEERASYAFELCTARPPDERDLEDLLGIFHAQRTDLAADPSRATKLLNVGALPLPEELDPVDLGAWMVVCNLILNLDEVVVRG